MFCKKCGQNNPDGSVFCSACGADLRGESSSSKNATEFNSKANEKIDMAKEVYGEASNVAKDFIKNPKEYIEGFIRKVTYNEKLPFAFIIAEAILAIIFAFVAKFTIFTLINKYVENSPAADYMIYVEDMLKETGNKTFMTIAMYSIIAVAIVCACRYVMAMLLSEKYNTKKIFAAYSITSIAEIASFLVTIVYTFILSIVGYIDYNKFIEATDNAKYMSYDSSQITSQLLVAYGKLVAPAFVIGIIFSILVSLIIIYEVICMIYVNDALDLSPKKKRTGKILILAFAIVLIIMNRFYGTFVCTKIFNEIANLLQKQIGSLASGISSIGGALSSFGNLF